MFRAPEWAQGRGPAGIASLLELAHLYSLAVTLYFAASHKLVESYEPQLGSELEALFARMSEHLARDRPGYVRMVP